MKSRIQNVIYFYGSSSNYSTMEKEAGERAAEKAIELEPDMKDGYIHLGYLKAFNGEWLKAEHNFHKALELSNGLLSAHDANIIPCYMAVGDFKKALEILDELKRNDPVNQGINMWYYLFYSCIGDRRQAEKTYQKRSKMMSAELSKTHDEFITDARLCSGDALSRDDVISSHRVQIIGRKYIDSPAEGIMDLRRFYNGNDNLSPYDLLSISRWAVYFGDVDFAMQVSEEATRKHALHISTFWTPLFKEVRQLPRFKELMKEIGLVDYWKKYGWPDLCHPVGDNDFVCK